MPKKSTIKKKKKTEVKLPNFSMSLECDSLSEPRLKVCKHFPKLASFTSLEFSEESILFKTQWGDGEISWEEMEDALSLITGATPPEEYFGLELADDDEYDDDEENEDDDEY